MSGRVTPVARSVTDPAGAVVGAAVGGGEVIDVDGPFDVVAGAVLAGMKLPPSPRVHAPLSTKAVTTTQGPARTFAPYGVPFGRCGGPGWDRTSDRRIMSPLL